MTTNFLSKQLSGLLGLLLFLQLPTYWQLSLSSLCSTWTTLHILGSSLQRFTDHFCPRAQSTSHRGQFTFFTQYSALAITRFNGAQRPPSRWNCGRWRMARSSRIGREFAKTRSRPKNENCSTTGPWCGVATIWSSSAAAGGEISRRGLIDG